MRRLRNLEFGRTGRLDRQHRHHIAATGVALAAALSGGGVTAVQAAEPGCGAKPGGKDQGAALQYCPKEVARAPRNGGLAASPGAAAATTDGRAVEKDARRKTAETESGPTAEIPLLGYPSTGGINALLLALLIGGVAMGAYLGYRRLRGRNEQHELP